MNVQRKRDVEEEIEKSGNCAFSHTDKTTTVKEIKKKELFTKKSKNS